MGNIDDIANRYVDEWAPLDPLSASGVGIAGYDDKMTDLSPAGMDALTELNRRTLAALLAATPDDEHQRVAQEAMVERLGLSVEMDEIRYRSMINVIASPLHEVRGAFDLMPTDTAEAVGNIATRMAMVPAALAGYQETLLHDARDGFAGARAQMEKVAAQCDAWTDPDGDNFYPGLAGRLEATGELRERLDAGAAAATAATADFARFLREELAPLGREREAVGRELYQLCSRFFLGARVDLDETYAWGFEEVARLRADMLLTADLIVPGGTVEQAAAALDADPSRRIGSKEEFRDWMQGLADKSIADLHGTHFDIPEQVRHMECMIAPTSDGGIYYTGPSEDFTRPGRMWWAVPAGVTSFATWREVTTVFHEGVPGHHLQVAQTAVRSEVLNRWQRVLSWCSGHGEGWALYAERLMGELGYLDDAGDRLGMLDAQLFRAARVVVDIGMHLELEIPAGVGWDQYAGQTWNPEIGYEFLRANCMMADEFLRFELDRYLGWPGQAPSYKVGERIWLQARADAEERKGTAFDLKEFHRAALDLGALGLDPLRAALARI
ncbi:hypothetical protein Lfu02_21530 [Longispora fulva]|uniref:Uncharacterized protein (DUF885 family) n=1 Tax=Longispora fulva TaxID=619741 RepID=A0A8J7GUM6_9ACTN|nr:DUF885 domain-containing protein [Longispora fulva]MBG6139835.1 uncharacterized protein (DUF885 family) [Longispora fulva]GIG57781.1 hypothetical protein Lfu02_21530 [Longispora fulva]